MPSPEAVKPQYATAADAVVASVEWLFEPYWVGDRLVARFADGRVSLTDGDGEPADHTHAEAAEELSSAIDASQALIDGVWTGMPFIGDGEGGARWADTLAEEGLVEERPDPLELEKRRAFVAVDLLELDGQPLYDIPLLERRRLLAGVLAENVRVRISPMVKLPIHSWLDAWRRNGFAFYVAKHQNSHYHPGESNEEWLILSAVPEAPPNIFQRLLGQRPKKVRRISDAPGA